MRLQKKVYIVVGGVKLRQIRTIVPGDYTVVGGVCVLAIFRYPLPSLCCIGLCIVM